MGRLPEIAPLLLQMRNYTKACCLLGRQDYERYSSSSAPFVMRFDSARGDWMNQGSWDHKCHLNEDNLLAVKAGSESFHLRGVVGASQCVLHGLRSAASTSGSHSCCQQSCRFLKAKQIYSSAFHRWISKTSSANMSTPSVLTHVSLL